MPGVRRLCTVTMKFRPVKIDENPVMNTPITTRKTLLLENIVEKGV